MNSDGTGQRQVTSGPGQDYAPIFAPDMTRIVFERESQNFTYSDVVLADPGGLDLGITPLTANAAARLRQQSRLAAPESPGLLTRTRRKKRSGAGSSGRSAGSERGRPGRGGGAVARIEVRRRTRRRSPCSPSQVDRMRLRILEESRLAEQARAEAHRGPGAGRGAGRGPAASNTELEQFAYVASHDLQEPLRKVASFCQLLERRYKGQLDERGEQYIDFAVDGAKRMQQLINDLLAFSRVGRTTSGLRDVDLEQVLAQAAAPARRPRSRRPVPSSPTTRCRRSRASASLLVQLFQNLVGNALKFRGRRRRRGCTCRRRRPRRPSVVGVLPAGQRHRHRAAVRRQDLRHLPAAARPGTTTGHRHRPGDVQEDRRVPRRPASGWTPTPAHAGAAFRWTLPVRQAPLDAGDDAPGPRHGRDERTAHDDRRARAPDRGPARRGRPRRRADDPRGVRGPQGRATSCTSSTTARRRMAFLRQEGEYADAPAARPGPARPQPAADGRARGARGDQGRPGAAPASRSWCSRRRRPRRTCCAATRCTRTPTSPSRSTSSGSSRSSARSTTSS